jgi:DNA modification methylase
VLEPGRGFYIWGGYANCANYPLVLKKHGLYFWQGIVWVKEHPVLTRKESRGSRVERVGFEWSLGIVK